MKGSQFLEDGQRSASDSSLRTIYDAANTALGMDLEKSVDYYVRGCAAGKGSNGGFLLL